MDEFKNLPHLKYDCGKPNEYIDPMKPLIEEFMTDFRIQEENHIMRAVADVGIVVDKPRLMQALTDAKAFYEEGYMAAMNRPNVVEVVRCKDCKYFVKYKCRADGGMEQMMCTLVNGTYDENWYCADGVAKMDGKGEGE